MSDQKVNRRFALLAGILAAGLFAAVFAGTQLVQSAAAQNNGTESEAENGESTVTASGTATTSVDPDKFTVTVGAETNGTTAEEATSSNADMVAAIIAALKELGISEDQITTTHYSIQPIYSHTEPERVEPGFNNMDTETEEPQDSSGNQTSTEALSRNQTSSETEEMADDASSNSTSAGGSEDSRDKSPAAEEGSSQEGTGGSAEREGQDGSSSETGEEQP